MSNVSSAFIYYDEVDSVEWTIPEDDPYWRCLKRDEGDGVRYTKTKVASNFGELKDGSAQDFEEYLTTGYHVTPAILFHDDNKGTIIVRQNPSRRLLAMINRGEGFGFLGGTSSCDGFGRAGMFSVGFPGALGKSFS